MGPTAACRRFLAFNRAATRPEARPIGTDEHAFGRRVGKVGDDPARLSTSGDGDDTGQEALDDEHARVLPRLAPGPSVRWLPTQWKTVFVSWC